MSTTMGDIDIELYPEKAPATVANFLRLVDEGYYNGLTFHRVIAGFMIQAGGYEKGRKPKENTRAPVKNESENRLKNLTGTVSMARRTHPDTATSQFFINLSHNDGLDYQGRYQPGYTVFGKVSKGMDVIQKIAEVPTTAIDPFKNIPKLAFLSEYTPPRIMFIASASALIILKIPFCPSAIFAVASGVASSRA